MSINFQEYLLELRATLPIKKGEQIFTRYTTPELTSLRRQFLLQNQWYFSCDCRRCIDPTECGTMGNAIKCWLKHEEDDNIANEYYLLPQNPRDLDSKWMCNFHPPHVVEPGDIKELIAEAEHSIKVAEKVSKVCFIYYQFDSH